MTSRRLIPRVMGLALAAGLGLIVLVLLLVSVMFSSQSASSGCAGAGGSNGAAAAPVLLAPGGGAVVGATEYGGPGDPSSGTVGSSGTDLLDDPDSYAELGGTSFATATALGGLAYGTPLRITWQRHSVIAAKQDIGLGGGPIDGHPRVIDLWWELAGRLGIPYENGLWSGQVQIQRPPAVGSAPTLAASPAGALGATAGTASAAGCDQGGGSGVSTVAGPRAQLLSDGQAAAPAGAPAQVKGIIAAGNQIAGRPYVYGGGHGLALDQVAPTYDCSSSVSHLLWGGGLLSASGDMTSGEYMSWGVPGPGRWITLYASDGHVFMYVAGLRWDTHNAAGAGDGSPGIGWHPLVREADGFVARHPVGL